jgi:hypothetical protein
MVELSRPTLPIALASGSVLILFRFEGVMLVKMKGQLSFSTAVPAPAEHEAKEHEA